MAELFALLCWHCCGVAIACDVCILLILGCGMLTCFVIGLLFGGLLLVVWWWRLVFGVGCDCAGLLFNCGV